MSEKNYIERKQVGDDDVLRICDKMVEAKGSDEVDGEDALVFDSVFMRSPNGSLWRVEVDDLGVVSATGI